MAVKQVAAADNKGKKQVTNDELKKKGKKN